MVEDVGVGGRVGARGAPDRRLVDVDDLVDRLQPVDAVVRARPQLRLVEAIGDGVVERLVDQRRLARARDSGHAAEDAERYVRVDPLQVVLAGAAHDQLAARLAPLGRHLDPPLAGQVLPGQRSRVGLDLRRGSLGDDVAAVLAGARAEVDDVVGGAHRPLVVLDDDHRVAQVAEAVQGRDQLLRCRAGANRSTARRGCTSPRPGWSRSASPDGSAAPRRLRGTGRSGPATDSRCRRCRGTKAARRSRARSGARSRARSRSSPGS